MEYSNTEIFALTGLVASAFVATNLDNLLLMVVLLGANAQRRSAVLLGFICSAIAVICICALGVALGSVIGAGLVGYLGVVPLLLGCHMLYQSWRGGKQENNNTAKPFAADTEPRIWLSTFILLLSNSGDSIALILPLLAESERTALIIIMCSYLLMAMLWAGLCYAISGQRALAARIEKSAAKIVPWVMIAMGIYILMDTGTDTLY